MLGPERRSDLLSTKLRALVRGSRSTELGDVDAIPGGVVARAGYHAYALIADEPERQLGPVLAAVLRHDTRSVTVFGDAGTRLDLLARRAGCFAVPIEVVAVDGTEIHPVVPAPAHVVTPPPPGVETLQAVLESAGVDTLVEHGRIRGEHLGLEVARIETDRAGVARLVAGVGQNDRDAFPQMYGDLPVADALAIVVPAVVAERHAASSHPFSRLAQSRWLRARLLEDPVALGIDAVVDLVPVESTLPTVELDDRAVAVAAGHDRDGPVVIACSVGIDLDAVPSAADARASHAPDARLVLLLPARDDHPVQRRLMGALRAPGSVQPLPGAWR